MMFEKLSLIRVLLTCTCLTFVGMLIYISRSNMLPQELAAVNVSAEVDSFALTTQQESDRQDQPTRRVRRSRAKEADRSEYPTWENETGFEQDVFTFARVKFDTYGSVDPRRSWANDYPDCDWNFSVRLHELTSLKVDPNGVVVRLDDESLSNYPFIFMSNVNRMAISDTEASSLRRHLFNGGFLMADDFWAPSSWRQVQKEMKKVFPDREPRELSADHDIFSIVYKIQGLPQVPSIRAWQRGYKYEYWYGDFEGDTAPHFWGYFDDKDRLMALFCHNNDIGDGWEREGENEEYFKTYSERVSFPLGINIVTYALTH